jgi:hypothetical protein
VTIKADDFEKIAEEARQYSLLMENDPVVMIDRLYKLWWNWADFSLTIITPTIDVIMPPVIIAPESLPDSNELEYVYPIHDYGYKLSTSKAEDMFSAGMSMCRLYYTIEKMIFLLVERLNSGGIDMETEVQVAFDGHELPRRKAFESIINLKHNVVVTNFEPGMWGDRYLELVKNLSEKGYGYPSETPRTPYRQPRGEAPATRRKV